MENNIRFCPYCGKEVGTMVKKCPYCEKWLPNYELEEPAIDADITVPDGDADNSIPADNADEGNNNSQPSSNNMSYIILAVGAMLAMIMIFHDNGMAIGGDYLPQYTEDSDSVYVDSVYNDNTGDYYPEGSTSDVYYDDTEGYDTAVSEPEGTYPY